MLRPGMSAEGGAQNNHVTNKPCQNLPFHPHQSSVALVAVQKLKPLDSYSSVLVIVTKQSCIFEPDSVLLSRGGFHRCCIKRLRLQNARPLFHVRKTSPMRADKSGILVIKITNTNLESWVEQVNQCIPTCWATTASWGSSGSGVERRAWSERRAVFKVRAGLHWSFRMSRQMAPFALLTFGCLQHK